MKINGKFKFYILCGVLLVSYPVYIYHGVIWKFMDKIGALATGLALFVAMYQGYVAWKAANLTREANSQNLFQQKFNLVLEQHNDSLARVRDWLKSNNYSDKIITTEWLISEIRGHEQLSPYMRILYHTLKSIKEELPVTDEFDEKEVIKIQKRYTSLVRSFIPNDILFLVACNASVIDRKIFEINDSESYSYYNLMLKNFDFFEHLKTQADKKISLEDLTKEVAYNTYESCYLYYFRRDFMEGADSKNNPHIIKLKEFLLNPDFFICLEYNLKNKAIDTSSFPDESLSVNEMLILSLNEYIRKLNEEDLNSYISFKTNEFYRERVEQIVQSENNIYTNASYLSSIKGLYYDAELIEFFTSFMRYDISMKDLLIFRDDFHSTLKSFILNSSSLHKNQGWYQYSVDASHIGIIKKISPLIDELIAFRNRINYTKLPSEVLKNKKEELQRYITSLSNQL
ncbi:hypothetical protein OI70_01025 [Dickeya fangzhongdai]|uniref:putative phage abortive infection protein n=1 Tax=Dickeya fangzhongdai TaxID=1778540 RepID=UPI0005751590|nr:putative phage abortive infection protein [Dickeya fangzhongdai]KHN62480.1 hypothetical protein OI70_01025 [Dickeya fangzhongdai]